MKPRILPGLLLGASVLAGGVASAAPFIANFEVHDDMHGGALWRNDRPNNNNQRGAGAEHVSMTVLGDKVVMFATASYTDVTPLIPGAGLSSAQAGIKPPADGDPGVQATGTRVEGLCSSYKIDAQQGLIKNNVAYVSKNNSPDWQNFHKPRAQAIDGGKAVLVLYGYDPNGVNTEVYGPNCEILSAQTKLFASNNDNLGGLSDGDTGLQALFSDAAGVSKACGAFIGNGNGNDDGHTYCVKTQATGQAGAAAYKVTPTFDFRQEPNEERTRPAAIKTPIADTMLACWAAGNNQPPDKGLRCGLINTADTVANNQRLVWRQYVQERKGNLMYTSPSLAAVLDADGKATNKFLLTYVEVDTTNRQGRAKGRTKILSVPIEVTPQSLKLLDTPKAGLFGISDGAHPGMVSGYYGTDRRPVGFMFTGTITDGGGAAVKIIGLDAAGKIEPVRALNWASAVSGGYTSLWYGHNPNTPQGRTYPPQALPVKNPGYGVAGGYQSTVKEFMLVSNVYHKDHAGQCTPDPNKGTNNGTCGGKNALGLVVVPISADPDQNSQGNTDDPNNPFPSDPTDPNEGDGEPAGATPTLGGCSASTGTEGAATMFLLGLGLMIARRRRSN
jgi:uncharacterized protein (TIGR03382 family)